jgi:hypothetical protein
MYLVVVAQLVVAYPKHMYTTVSSPGIASDAYGHRCGLQSTRYAYPEGSQIPEFIEKSYLPCCWIACPEHMYTNKHVVMSNLVISSQPMLTLTAYTQYEQLVIYWHYS